MNKGLIIAEIILILILFFGLVLPAIKQNLLFKKGHNPYNRVCNKCGAHQSVFSYNYRNAPSWWEEVYPIGNNPKCKCHKYVKQ